jgi:hypothetical protein
MKGPLVPWTREALKLAQAVRKLGRQRQENLQFQAKLGNKVSSRSAWATQQDTVSKHHQQE